ncbi:MAG: cob(I)yrinic acid a,c-diamide adenosyltransferase [bacterium JZ-2024 1]
MKRRYRIDRVVTKMGDKGKTSLIGEKQVWKDSPRIRSLGEIDELNSVLGIVLHKIKNSGVKERILRVQQELFIAGADVATSRGAAVRIPPQFIHRLEKECEEWISSLPPLKEFVLPGGSEGGALLFWARAICRRVERSIVSLHRKNPVNPHLLSYFNRLSDWLFLAARAENAYLQVPEHLMKFPTKKGGEK